MKTIQPYYIAPLLIEQPTWGGEYIVSYKSISDQHFAKLKIGQAFELAAETQLTTQNSECFLFASATSINQSEQAGESPLFSLSDLIAQDPTAVLGSDVVKKHGATMPLLIKFTQAKSNSYQVHTKKNKTFGHWLPKPESWFFFEKGKATLGLNPNKNVKDYKRRCQKIYTKAQKISEKIHAQQVSLTEGTKQLETFIEQDHPRNYVNTIFPASNSIIDLSQGGTHHSWETDEAVPNGNIVYEVQLDVKDEFCTIRSFDQGKFKDDGSIRNLSIDDYFKALEINPSKNDPTLYQQPAKSYQDQNATITELFATENYHLTSIELTNKYHGSFTTTSVGFHHLFVKSGSDVKIVTNKGKFPVTKGWSLFIPAAVEKYSIQSSGKTTILKTTA
jgi:mannose-6-phosphate isomerase class I